MARWAAAGFSARAERAAGAAGFFCAVWCSYGNFALKKKHETQETKKHGARLLVTVLHYPGGRPGCAVCVKGNLILRAWRCGGLFSLSIIPMKSFPIRPQISPHTAEGLLRKRAGKCPHKRTQTHNNNNNNNNNTKKSASPSRAVSREPRRASRATRGTA